MKSMIPLPGEKSTLNSVSLINPFLLKIDGECRK